MDKNERSALIKSLSVAVREYVAQSMVEVRNFISGEVKALTELLEERIKSIPSGKDGLPGERGERGERGETGERGIAGERGQKGDPGERGERGERGEAGESIKGEKGDPGERGLIGPTGERGERGEPGQSIKGDKGDPGESIVGPQGERGERGERGLPGEKGEPGEPGRIGERGEKGIDGKDGRDGRDAKDGRDGEPGRDALQLEILPAIDEHKSYPRGTFVAHAGGLWWASRNTAPLVEGIEKSGWENIVNGIADMKDVETDDERHVQVELITSNGAKLVIERHWKVPLFKGVWEVGKDYREADMVQRDGSVWYCNVTGTKVAPGTPGTTDWTLSTKRGNHGKDADTRVPPQPQPVRLK